MSRYVEDRDHRGDSRRDKRERGDPRERIDSTRRREVVEDHRSDRRGDTRMTGDSMDFTTDPRAEGRMNPRIDSRMMDPMMDQNYSRDMGRDTTRANTSASRIDPRSDRMGDSRSAEPELYKDPISGQYRDPTTGQLYRQVPASLARPTGYSRGDDRDYNEPTQRSRTATDTAMRDEPRATLTEYWCSGDGIEREVLQGEICKFLGPDATCRPGTDRQVCHSLASGKFDTLTASSGTRWILGEGLSAIHNGMLTA